MEIEFLCTACGKSNQFETESEASALACSGCGKVYGSFSEFAASGAVSRCAVCGCRDLYTQKDFSRKVGCAIAAIGAALAPFTKLISLLVCALIDLILYKLLAVITVCYRCGSIYRGFTLNPDHGGFNLGINDRYRSEER